MEDIAEAAGISRQTVYAHFGSRDALLSKVFERLTHRVAAAVDAAALESGPAADALVRFLQAAWQASIGEPWLLHVVPPPLSPDDELDLHEPIRARLENLIERGQRSGEFDSALPVAWLVSATIALAHTAGDEVRAGSLTADEAMTALQRTVSRLVANDASDRPRPSPPTRPSTRTNPAGKRRPK
jgi:AcrR family transcriptional regulator